jgi:hypothetical protein
MLDDVKQLLIARYGDRWLNGSSNQNGIAEDLSILEGDVTRTSRKFGIVGRGMYISSDVEVVASYEVIKPIGSLLEIDAVFYNWWGHRASENISFIQREIADDEVIYHFVTGTPSHGHSGRIVFIGHRIQDVIRRRWDERLEKLKTMETEEVETPSSADASASNG